jgi:hypothetical protein
MKIQDVKLDGKTLQNMTVKESSRIPNNRRLEWTFSESIGDTIKIGTTCSDTYDINESPGTDEEDESIMVSVIFDFEDKRSLEYHYFYETYHHRHKRAKRPLRESYWIWKTSPKHYVRWRGRWSQSKFSRLNKFVSSKTIECLKQIVKHLYFPLHGKGKFAIDNRWMNSLPVKLNS